jgi:hypothetical protein
MKRFLIVIALACVFSGSVLAGDIHTTGAPAPAPGQTQGPGIAAAIVITVLSLVR